MEWDGQSKSEDELKSEICVLLYFYKFILNTLSVELNSLPSSVCHKECTVVC